MTAPVITRNIRGKDTLVYSKSGNAPVVYGNGVIADRVAEQLNKDYPHLIWRTDYQWRRHFLILAQYREGKKD